jgi:hypothetical protein
MTLGLSISLKLNLLMTIESSFYNWHMFIVQATDVQLFEYIMRSPREWEKNQIIKKDWRSFKVEFKTNVLLIS